MTPRNPADRPATDKAVEALEDHLRYHLADHFPDDADWADFAARIVKDMKGDGFEIVRPYLLDKAVIR